MSAQPYNLNGSLVSIIGLKVVKVTMMDHTDRAKGPTPLPGNLQDEYMRERAWHYFGYPAFAEWMSSSNDCFILRRFSRSSARCLLGLQHEIAKREKELDNWDRYFMSLDLGKGGCSLIENDHPRRQEVIDELAPLLQRYYDLVNSFAEVKSRPTTKKHHNRNLSEWFKHYPNAIDKSEQHWRNQNGEILESDLFPLITKDKSPLRLFLEQWRWLRFCFKLGPKNDLLDMDVLTYTSEKGFERFTNVTVLVLGLALLFGPMWWLNFVSDDVERLSIITGFVTAFTLVIWSAAGQRPFEILAATAAYAAVLMVFLQTNSGGSGSGAIAVKSVTN